MGLLIGGYLTCYRGVGRASAYRSCLALPAARLAPHGGTPTAASAVITVHQ